MRSTCFHNFIYHLRSLSLILVSILLISCATAEEDKASESKKGLAAMTVGEAYLAQKDYTGALREFRKALNSIPDNPFLHNDLGLTYQGKGRLDLAIEHFNRAIAIKPDYTPAINNLGSAYLADRQYDKAIEVLGQITGDLLYATPHYPYALIGRAYFHKEEYSKAIENFQNALKYEPDFVFALNWLGRAYLMTDKDHEAIKQFQRSIRVAPKFLETYFDLAFAYQRTGQTEKAINVYKRLKELSPEDSEIHAEAKKRSDELSVLAD